MCWFNPREVKAALLWSAVPYIGCAAMSIVLGYFAQTKPILGILGKFYGYDIQFWLFVSWWALGAYLIFLIWWVGLATAKRHCIWRCMFVTVLMPALIFYFVWALSSFAVIYQSEIILDELCNGKAASTNIEKGFDQLYNSADQILWVSTNGCACQVDHTISSSARAYATSGTGVTKTQECDDHLMTAFSGYPISFSSKDELKEYLDYFGTIEKEYDWSGICTQRDVYYFSNTKSGVPKGRCKEHIIEGAIKSTLYFYTFGALITALWLFASFLIQYWLCCRGKKKRVGIRHSRVRQISDSDMKDF